RALMAADRADAPQGVQPRVQPPVQRPPRIRRSAPDAMPDLAAACAEAFDRPRERAPRPRVTTRMRPPEIVTDDGEHALLRHALTQPEAEIARLQDAAADGRFAHPAFPCGSCSSTCADAAMAEVINVYIAARRGELNLVGNVLPKSCCQRQLRCVDARALIA